MRTSVAIIGAGFSGTLTAIHVARNVPAKSNLDIYLIDPRGAFGPGLAYSPPSERFKLNVHAQAMGAFPDDVEGFHRWLKERHPNSSPDDFASRLHYGAYLTDILNEASSRPDSHCLHRMSDEVVDMIRESLSGRWELTLKSGSKLAVDACVLAIGNLMQTSSLSRGSTNGFRQPFDPKSYEDLASREHVFILGASLTAIDVVLECEGRGFKGSYTLLSRHGRFPRSHEELPATAVAHLPSNWDTRGSVRALVETIRAESHRLGSSQPVFDAMRPKIQSMWQHLSLSERKRFLRHVRPMWDVHRHRIPSKHAAVLEQLQSSHRLQLIAGRLVECKPDGARLSVALRERGPLGAIIRRSFDVAFRCTGPEADITKTDSPLLKSLCVQNLIEPGPLGLGPLRASEDSIPLWLMGPLQRENLFEITAVREIRQQAYEVATEIQDFLATATTASNQ